MGSSVKNEPLQRNQYASRWADRFAATRPSSFADLEKTNIRQGQDNNSEVPSSAQLTGAFGGTKITDPTTHVQFPNNQIPASLISPQARFLLPYIPASNYLQGSTYRAVLIAKLGIDATKADLRLDHQITVNDQLSGHYSVGENSENDPNAFPAL